MRRDDPCSSLDGDGDDSEDQHDQDTADLMMDPSQPVSRAVFISRPSPGHTTCIFASKLILTR